jgi:hypothetical protein
MKVTRKMKSFEGKAAGSTASCSGAIGLTYEQVLITYSGMTLAQMNEIRVLGNGKVFQRYSSGQVLDLMNTFEGRAAAAGIIVLDFNRYGLRTRDGEEVTGVGTGIPSVDGKVELTNFHIEIDIDSGAAGPIALKAVAIQSAPRPLGLVKYVREYIHNPTAVGEYEITNIPTGHLFQKMYFRSSAVNQLRIERDGYTVFERSLAENVLVQTDGVRKPQPNVMVFDPSETGNGGETLQTAGVNDLRFIPNLTGASAMPVVVESIAPLF